MDRNLKVGAPAPGALFDLDDDKPTADPLAELLIEILKVEVNYDRGQKVKTLAA